MVFRKLAGKQAVYFLLALMAIISSVVILHPAASAQTLQRPVGTGIQEATPAAQHHYLYVLPNGSLSIYDMDNGQSLIKQVSLPTLGGVRGVVASPATATLYVSYGGDGGSHGNGSLLAYNLLTNTIAWTQNYSFGVDSMGISPDGKTIYMPDGDFNFDGLWYVLNASDGNVLGSIQTGTGASPHNTLVSLNGAHVYLGGLNYDYLQVADTSTNQVIKRIGPLQGGVRPFTINGTETLAFTTATGFLGFQVSNIATGQVLYTVPIKGFTAPPGTDAPSHGISLSPDEKEVYVMDSSNSYVHVFDVSGLPANAPQQIADIPVHSMAGQESPCAYDCQREGWMLHSRDGRFVYVGDSGDVINTATRKSVANLSALTNSRKFLEIDWANGSPIFATTRHGVGYVIGGGPTPTATSTPPPTPTATFTPSPTPVPGQTIARDTFHRANQTGWGKASDGQTWMGDAGSAAFSIAANHGVIKGSSSTQIYNAILGPTINNSEVLIRGTVSLFGDSNFGAVARWSDTNNWYKAYIDGSNLVIQQKVNGVYTVLGTVPFGATPGTSYTLRFRVVGTTLEARVWLTSVTEPTTWQINVTSNALASGYCGLRVQIQSGATINVTSFKATSAS